MLVRKSVGKPSKSRRRQSRRNPEKLRSRIDGPLRFEPLEERVLLSITLNDDFGGIDQITSRPPDPIVSAGPEHLVAMVNTHIALYDKDGNQLELADLDAPFGGNTGFFEDVDAEFGSFDPWTVYDRYSDRFFVLAEEVEFGVDDEGDPLRGGFGADEAFLLIGVSTSDAPDDLDVAPGDLDLDWRTVSIPATHDFGDGLAWIDYPKFATDADSVYITGNYFSFGNRDFQGVLVTRLDKGDLLNGIATVTAEVEPNVETFTLQPVQSINRLPGQPQLFVDAFKDGGPGVIGVWEMDDANNLSLIDDLAAPFDTFFGGAPQPGTGDTLDTLSDRLMNAAWRDESIWTAHTVEVGGDATVRWYEIDTTGGVHSLIQSGDINPGDDIHTFMPSIGVDASGNMGITFTQSADDQAARMMVTGRKAGQPFGFTEPPVTVEIGAAGYAPSAADDVERWGDYAGLALDPIDDHTFWAFGEVALNTTTWTTHFAQFEVGPLPEDEFDLGGATNNSLATATVLGSLPKITLRDLTIDDSDDVDYFKITAQDTGKLIINAFFQDALGDIDIRVVDMHGNFIANSISITDNEQVVIPVVSQEMYFLRVIGFSGDTNVYDLEIENFPAPVPSGVHLDPASDTGMMSNDNYTADNTPRIIVQADLSDFADMGIDILDPGEVAADEDGAAVEVFITNSTTGVTTSGFASQVGGISNILFEFTPAGPLGDGTYFVSAAVRIFDGQGDEDGFADPATARTQLSSPLWMTIDTVGPAPSLPDLLASSDTGMLNDDDVTSKMQPAFQGQGEPNAKVRVLANGVVVGQGVVNTNGNWEVTVEPLADGQYEITTELEDLAGNVGGFDEQEPLTIWIDTTEPNTPLIDLIAADDTGHSDTDNITNVNTPTLVLIGNDTVDGDGNPFPNDVKYRLYDRPGPGTGEVLLFDSFATFGDFVDFGQITFFTPGGLADGVHNLKLEIEDRAGNISHDFLLTVEIDTITPIADPPDLLESSDTGMFNDDNVTNKMQPAFTGVSEVNSTVRVFAQNVITGTINLVGVGVVGSDNSNNVLGDDQGRYEVTVEPLADGTYDIFVEIEDWAGNQDTSETLRIEVDATEPNTPYLDLLDDNGHSPFDNITNDNTPEVSMTTEDPNSAFHILFTDNLKFRIFDRYEGDEEFLLYDSAIDAAVDAVSTAADGFTSLQLILETLPEQYFTMFGANLPAVTVAGTLADGVHNLKLEVEDRAGNISHDFLLSIEIDSVVPDAFPPDLLASSDSGMFDDDNVTNKMEPAFTGVAEANAVVRVFATNVVTGEVQLVGEGVVGSDLSDVSIGGVGGIGGEPDDGLGLWEVTVEPLVDAVYDIQVEFEDWGGNVSELSDPLRIEIDTLQPNTAFLDLLESSDTGRHNDDNVTFDNTPTFSMTTEDPNASLHQILFTDNLKFRIFDRFENDEEFLLYNSVLDVAVDNIMTAADGFTSLQQILETLPQQFFALFGSNTAVTAAGTLADGFHDLKLEVEDRAGNISHDFLFDLLIDTEAPPVTILGIDPRFTDTGVEGFPATFTDRVTSDTETGFIGRAEANSIVRLFVDATNNNLINFPTQFALTVAVPLDGDDAFPDGEWRTSFLRDLNDPALFPFDRLREVLVTAEDLAGNVNLVNDGNGDAAQMLDIFIDTQGPQVTDVFLTDFPSFDLFDPKPSEGPTPPVFSITIDVRDLPARDDDDPNFLYKALLEAVAEEAGHYVLRGDANGVIPILDVEVINDPRFNNTIATASILLSFAEPLPDDRYTLTLSDTIVDPVGNALDGETNTIEPQEIPMFPSGDGQPGGDFVARFTIDSRPEIGTYAHSDVYLDINGNFTFDPTNVDFVNRDLASQFGALNDDLFNGNFAPAGAVSANGFDKLGAYGQVGGVFRFLIDFNGNMAVDPGETIVSNIQVNALPVSGDFAPAHPGDEIGLFDGTTWFLDTTGNFALDTTISGNLRGFPIVGDFDGDGNDDLATYQADLFRFDLNFDGNTDDTIAFGFPGVLDRPVAKDYNLDGIDDIGLFVPDRDGVTPGEVAEWFFLLSEREDFDDDSGEFEGAGNNGFGTVDALDHPFSPVPLGNDIFAQFGDDLAIPLFGNFDPPVTLTTGDEADAVDGVGVYDPVAGVFHQKNENSNGAADNSFRYGPKDAGWLPVSGDWDGDSDTTVGLFDPVHGTFFLTNENAAGIADHVVRFGPAGSGWTPVTGDWDGDGDVTIGLFNPATGTFFLKNDNSAGAADVTVRYGPAGSGWTPVVGDFDGDGDDTIGLFDPAAGTFYLKNSNTPGAADMTFRYGPAGAGWMPTLGDWDGDGDDTVGLYDPTSGAFFLRNEHAGGVADVQLTYASAGAGMVPLAGDWDGAAASGASESTDFGLLAGVASFTGGSSSTSDADSSGDSTTTSLLNTMASAVAAHSSTSASSTGDAGSAGNISGSSTDDGADDVLDLALLELSGEWPADGGIDPLV